jgi:chromate transport protein ChrA
LHRALGHAAQGVSSAVVGLLLATMCRFGRGAIGGPVAMGIALAAFGSATLLRLPAAPVVAAAGVIGILLIPPRASEGRGRSRRGRGGRS